MDHPEDPFMPAYEVARAVRDGAIVARCVRKCMVLRIQRIWLAGSLFAATCSGMLMQKVRHTETHGV